MAQSNVLTSHPLGTLKTVQYGCAAASSTQLETSQAEISKATIQGPQLPNAAASKNVRSKKSGLRLDRMGPPAGWLGRRQQRLPFPALAQRWALRLVDLLIQPPGQTTDARQLSAAFARHEQPSRRHRTKNPAKRKEHARKKRDALIYSTPDQPSHNEKSRQPSSALRTPAVHGLDARQRASKP